MKVRAVTTTSCADAKGDIVRARVFLPGVRRGASRSDILDFEIMSGALMLIVAPHSNKEQRGALFEALLASAVAGKPASLPFGGRRWSAATEADGLALTMIRAR